MPPSTDVHAVANRMRMVRERAGLTRAEVAGRLDVDESAYARWERADAPGFMYHIDEVASALGTTPEVLLGEVERWPPMSPAEHRARLDAAGADIGQMRRALDELQDD